MPNERQLAGVEPDDATLVARFLGGDEAAFTEIFRRHARWIAGVAFRLMGDALEMDDVVQDVFADAAEDLGSLRDPALLRAWLVAMAVRRVHRRLRRRALRRLLGREVAREAPRASDPSALAELHALGDALDRLSSGHRIPWVLHRLEGLSLPEVASATGASLATVKRRIAAAEKRLRRKLDAR